MKPYGRDRARLQPQFQPLHCPVLFRLLKKQRRPPDARVKAPGFRRFAAAGTGVASLEKLKTLGLENRRPTCRCSSSPAVPVMVCSGQYGRRRRAVKNLFTRWRAAGIVTVKELVGIKSFHP